MSATWGNMLKLTVFGESHGAAIGGVLDGIRAGTEVDEQYIAAQMARRAPGSKLSTPRSEADAVEILSGKRPYKRRAAGFCHTQPQYKERGLFPVCRYAEAFAQRLPGRRQISRL